MTPFKNRFLALLTIMAVAFLTLAPQASQAQAFTDYAENKISDALLRGQALGAPSTWYVRLFTTAPTDSTLGTEVSGGSYAAASFTASLANWSGTQSAGSTTASSGTGGVSSNNGTISFTTPTGSWGTVTNWCLMDAATGGNAWICGALTASQTISTGNTVSFAANSLQLTVQ